MDNNGEQDLHQSSSGHVMSGTSWLDQHYLAMQPEYEEMVHWVGIQQGWKILDAACGAGSFVPLLCELVGSHGKVHALDLSAENVQALEREAQRSEWGPTVATHVGTILATPFEDDAFDMVWCANTMQYLTDDELLLAIAEFRRIVRPNGLIVLKDYDESAMAIQPTPPYLMTHLDEALAKVDEYRTNLHGLNRTIQLGMWMRKAGLKEIRQKPTLMVRLQPLRNIEKQWLRELIRVNAELARTADLPETEKDVWQSLENVDAEEHILNHPDFQYRAIQTVFVGIN
ncbi:MAG: methyltransferase domain-containing protein [Caldilineaceae bacterium]